MAYEAHRFIAFRFLREIWRGCKVKDETIDSSSKMKSRTATVRKLHVDGNWCMKLKVFDHIEVTNHRRIVRYINDDKAQSKRGDFNGASQYF